jgi:hypothetical protein
MPSSSSADQVADSPAPRLPADHPAVNELFALLAYAEVAAFYRLTGRRLGDVFGVGTRARVTAIEKHDTTPNYVTERLATHV